MNNIKLWWQELTKQQRYAVIAGAVLVVGVAGLGSAMALTGGSSESTESDSDSTSLFRRGSLPDSDDKSDDLPENSSPFSGQECERYNGRPIAVMMAGDAAARPLSGISQADMVVEMPVITGSVTRLMGVFVCNLPEEVGSMRSARHDYVSLVRGWDAIFVHWGGSHFVLDELKTGVRYTGENLGPVDNVNALSANGPFFRRNFAPAPHNGFSSMSKVLEYAESRGYGLENTFEGYRFHGPLAVEESSADAEAGSLYVGFGGVFAVRWDYQPNENHYVRYWSNQKDSDRSTGGEVTAKNVVVMRAASRQIEGQYNTVDIYGEGEMKLYQNGQEINGTWKKDGFKGTLRFFGEDGQELKLVPGQTFVQIIEPGQSLVWELN